MPAICIRSVREGSACRLRVVLFRRLRPTLTFVSNLLCLIPAYTWASTIRRALLVSRRLRPYPTRSHLEFNPQCGVNVRYLRDIFG
ncbi:hypothetical protein C8F04DRAFT_625078 [Mycena alexandri]|uniref:Uncharacterized protein n=1 Tax=Mycena alexandri TaxID=1745969 RepID=A0AAD6SUR0_9AGAR|nr:hypothetical protein C8F04DRAFT_625078 [Mycena alexandri]